jgi:hypothetical protein
LAGARAAVAIGGVSVVTGLATCDLAVATDRGAGLSRDATLVTGFYGLAVSRATIAALGVVVVASLVNRQYSIPTYPLINARLVRFTQPVGFLLAGGAATIIFPVGIQFLLRGYSVIAGLAVIHNAVAAILEVALGVACVRGFDTTGDSTSAAAGAGALRTSPAGTASCSTSRLAPACVRVSHLGGTAVHSGQ